MALMLALASVVAACPQGESMPSSRSISCVTSSSICSVLAEKTQNRSHQTAISTTQQLVVRIHGKS